MWKISKQTFGFVLTFAGIIGPEEMKAWVTQSKVELAGQLPSIWGVIVDMRELQPLNQASQAVMLEGQIAYKARGMVRSAVALQDAITTLQFRRLARNSGIDAWERYIDAAENPNWQSIAKQWIVAGAEPPTAR